MAFRGNLLHEKDPFRNPEAGDLCLASPKEIARKSPDYAQLIDSGALPWPHDPLPIEDFGAPAEDAVFWRGAEELAAFVRDGGKALVHCAAGMGRTGTFAVALCMRLGLPLVEATSIIRAAGTLDSAGARLHTSAEFTTKFVDLVPDVAAPIAVLVLVSPQLLVAIVAPLPLDPLLAVRQRILLGKQHIFDVALQRSRLKSVSMLILRVSQSALR